MVKLRRAFFGEDVKIFLREVVIALELVLGHLEERPCPAAGRRCGVVYRVLSMFQADFSRVGIVVRGGVWRSGGCSSACEEYEAAEIVGQIGHTDSLVMAWSRLFVRIISMMGCF